MKNNKNLGGIILVVIGIIFFLKNFINIPIYINWSYVWPVIIIVIGARLYYKK